MLVEAAESETDTASSVSDNEDHKAERLSEHRELFLRSVLEALLAIDAHRRRASKKEKKEKTKEKAAGHKRSTSEREAAMALLMDANAEAAEEEAIIQSLSALTNPSPPLPSPPARSRTRLVKAPRRGVASPPAAAGVAAAASPRTLGKRVSRPSARFEEDDDGDFQEPAPTRARKTADAVASGERRSSGGSVFEERDDKIILKVLASRNGDTPNWCAAPCTPPARAADVHAQEADSGPRSERAIHRRPGRCVALLAWGGCLLTRCHHCSAALSSCAGAQTARLRRGHLVA